VYSYQEEIDPEIIMNVDKVVSIGEEYAINDVEIKNTIRGWFN